MQNNPLTELIGTSLIGLWISILWFWVIGAVTMYSAPWAEWWLWTWLPSIVIYIGVILVILGFLIV